MMHCEQARQFFDAYLDGELSAQLATELGAHRVRCSDCRRTLALLEVSGHIVRSDEEPVALREDFSDRLLACMQATGHGVWSRLRLKVYAAGLLAAAAIVVLAFVGMFDGGEPMVAGQKERAPGGVERTDGPAVASPGADGLPWIPGDAAHSDVVERVRDNNILEETFNFTLRIRFNEHYTHYTRSN